MNAQQLALVLALIVMLIGFWMLRTLGLLWHDYRRRFQDSAHHNLAELFLFLDPATLFQAHLALVIIGCVLMLALGGGLFLALASAAVLAAAPTFGYRWLRRRRFRTTVAQLPDALRAIATSLRSGMSLGQAIENLLDFQKAPLAQELELMLREIRLGVAYEEAVDHLHQRVPEIEVQLVTAAMKLSREVGGNLAETLERISDSLRQRLQMEGKIRSLTAQGKLQGLVMTGLPLFMILALGQLEPTAMQYLFGAWYGWATLAVIIGLEVVGYHFIRRIVNIDV